MAGCLLSSIEQVYITQGINEDFRADGRDIIDYRPMELETDVVSHTSGSARLRLANTDILVGVKTEIDVPSLENPKLGKIEFFVDCSANATPEFEGRGGERLANNISNMMQRAYHASQAFNLEQLCILEGKQCWKLYIDILILECGGNLCDAVSLAVKAALFNTKIPQVKAVLMDGGNVDLQLSDDLYESKLLDAGSAPLLVTLCKIGLQCVVDPSAEEESCSSASLIVGITGDPRNYVSNQEADEMPDVKGKCTTIGMSGAGSFSDATLNNALQQGAYAVTFLDRALGDALLRERKENVTVKKHSYGFLK